jgi:hypothetical protein
MTRGAVAALLALLALAGCSSGGSGTSAPTTTPGGDERAYVDAVYQGLIAETPTVSKDDLRCVAQAIVDGIGLGRLHDAGVTIAALRDPDFEPPEMIAREMKTAERVAFATTLQSCGIGRLVGASVAGSFGSLEGARRARAQECVARGFAGAPARRMIAGLMLNDVSIPDSMRLARITIDCVGLARLVANAGGFELGAAESACITRAGRADPTFLRLLADEFRNLPSTAKTARDRVGARVAACLTPAHRAALAPSA